MNPGFVIPTRHRPELAMAAVRALLAQHETPVTVVVSDNSSRAEDVSRLRGFCDAASDPRLFYIRPPEVLQMPAHWDWAVEQAMARTTATHFGVHYDRMIAKPGSVERLFRACARHLDALVRYACDFTHTSGRRFGGWQFPTTGKDFEIATSTIVQRTAQGRLSGIWYYWPLLLNCMVPRSVFGKIRARFGTICDSATPEGAFAYRFCAVADRYILLDQSFGVMYAHHLSHGHAYLRRQMTGARQDFVALQDDRARLAAAPIPGLHLGLNIILHEYNLVQRAAGFPPIDRDSFLRELALSVGLIEDREEQANMRRILADHGWREELPPAVPLWRRAVRRLRTALRRTREPRFRTEAEAVQYLRRGEPPGTYNPMLDELDVVER